MVNIFIELGHKLMSAAWCDTANPNVIINKNEIVDSFKKHAFSSELKEESVGDQVAEIIFRKLLEQAGLADHNQICQTQNPALPDQQTDTSNTKTQKYVT